MSVATVSQNSVLDSSNSSTTPLIAGATFTGTAFDASIFASINVFVFTDQAGTLFVDFSVDGANWDKTYSYAVVASTANVQRVAPDARFVRVRYTNGGTPQTVFRLQTLHQPLAAQAASSVTGTVTANQGTGAALAGYWPVRVTDGANTMPTMDTAARSGFQRITDGTNTASITGASALRVDGSAVTQPVSATTLPLPTGAAQEHVTAASPNATRLSDGAAFYDAAKTGQLPAVLVGGRLDVNLGAWLGSTAPTVGQKTSADSIPVVLASDQSAVTVTGTVTANNASVGSNNAAAPSSSTQVGGSDGTNLQAARVFDADSGAGTQYVLGVSLRQTASGGSVELGTSSDPVRTDPTGTTTQPVSGTVTANVGTTGGLALDATLTGGTQTTRITDGTNTASVSAANALKVDGSAVTQPISAAALPLPTGAATSANQTTLGSQTTQINDGTNTAAVTAASALKVDGSAVTQPISAASLPLPTGAAQEHVTSGSPHSVRLSDGAAFYDAAKTGQLPSALVGGRLDVNVGAWLGSTAPTVGQKTAANSIPTVLASDQAALPTNVYGTHANAWNAAAVPANGTSSSLDTQYAPHVSAFGNSSGATTITLQLSQDNTNFYNGETASVGGGGGDFAIDATVGARYVRLRSSNARTITATLAAKD